MEAANFYDVTLEVTSFLPHAIGHTDSPCYKTGIMSRYEILGWESLGTMLDVGYNHEYIYLYLYMYIFIIKL